MVTSLVAALLLHFRMVDITMDCLDKRVEFTSSSQALIHNLSQFCHSLAQGKVGSGFDVSSAVYGSQLYSRFTPTFLLDAMQKVREWVFLLLGVDHGLQLDFSFDKRKKPKVGDSICSSVINLQLEPKTSPVPTAAWILHPVGRY